MKGHLGVGMRGGASEVSGSEGENVLLSDRKAGGWRRIKFTTSLAQYFRLILQKK